MEMLTQTEHDQIKKRLRELEANRPALSSRIAEARALGDLKENAEYHAAREQQGLEEAEIRRLSERLERAQIVDSEMAKSAAVVFLGSTVKLRDQKTGDEDLYRLVGEASGDEDDEVVEVTTSSPMGEALLKARVGETIRVKAPRGVKTFEVIELL